MSVPYRYVPSLKQRIQQLNLSDCREFAQDVLKETSTQKVREMVASLDKMELFAHANVD